MVATLLVFQKSRFDDISHTFVAPSPRIVRGEEGVRVGERTAKSEEGKTWGPFRRLPIIVRVIFGLNFSIRSRTLWVPERSHMQPRNSLQPPLPHCDDPPPALQRKIFFRFSLICSSVAVAQSACSAVSQSLASSRRRVRSFCVSP